MPEDIHGYPIPRWSDEDRANYEAWAGKCPHGDDSFAAFYWWHAKEKEFLKSHSFVEEVGWVDWSD